MQAKEDFKKMMEEAKFNPRYMVHYCQISKVYVFSPRSVIRKDFWT